MLRLKGPGGHDGTFLWQRNSFPRFGSVLNLNLHFHSLHLDGLFAENAGERLRFAPLPPPTDEAGLFADELPDDNGDDWTHREEGSQIARAPA